jgi:hypothetical protein
VTKSVQHNNGVSIQGSVATNKMIIGKDWKGSGLGFISRYYRGVRQE